MTNQQKAYRFAQEHPEAAQEAQEAIQAILARAATDAEFRQSLLSEPRTALANFTGREVPETFNVVFIENQADATFVLPDPLDSEAELTDEELEAVAGGEFVVGAGVICGIVAGSALLGLTIWIAK